MSSPAELKLYHATDIDANVCLSSEMYVALFWGVMP